ncbi:hypothetical protein L1887_58108 [Cichorium endivia]|nr:hypothetical protein L1887_58108 [Cichorium endivia]
MATGAAGFSQLAFVNYGMNDADEICSAVAPSGSYKVPLRGFGASSGEEDDFDDETSSVRTRTMSNVTGTTAMAGSDDDDFDMTSPASASGAVPGSPTKRLRKNSSRPMLTASGSSPLKSKRSMANIGSSRTWDLNRSPRKAKSGILSPVSSAGRVACRSCCLSFNTPLDLAIHCQFIHLFFFFVDLVSFALRAVATSVGVRTLHIRRPRPVTLPPISYSETRGDEWQPTILWPNGRVAWIFPPRLRAMSCSKSVWLSVKAGEGWRAEGRACADADDENANVTRRTAIPARELGSDTDDHLADVLAGKEVVERPGAFLETLALRACLGVVLFADYVELACKLALVHPSCHVVLRLRVSLEVVKDNEALELDAHGDDGLVVLEAVGLGVVVVRDGAAQRNAAVRLHAQQRHVQNAAADILKDGIDVAVLLDDQVAVGLAEVGRLVVERLVGAERLFEPLALVIRAGDGDDLGALELGELDGDGADGACRAGDDDDIVLLDGSYVLDAPVGGLTRGAERAEEVEERSTLADGALLDRLAGEAGVLLPAKRAAHLVALGEAGELGGDDGADAAGAHHLANLDGGQVGARVAQPAAHGGVERDILDADEHLARRSEPWIEPGRAGSVEQAKTAARQYGDRVDRLPRLGARCVWPSSNAGFEEEKGSFLTGAGQSSRYRQRRVAAKVPASRLSLGRGSDGLGSAALTHRLPSRSTLMQAPHGPAGHFISRTRKSRIRQM